MRRRMTTAVLGLAAIAGALSLPGCGSGSVVKGKVTYQGKTVVWGSVNLIDSAGAAHSGDIDLQGNYSIPKVAPGTVLIGVSSPNPDPGGTRGKAVASKPADDPREKFLQEKGFKKAESTMPKPAPGAWFPLPLAYIDANSSKLQGEVKGGTTELNLELK